MPAPTSYIFYGVVEDPFVNNVPVLFGYTPGEQITGSLTLTDSVAATWISLPEESRVLEIPEDLARAEVDFLLPQTGRYVWTEANFFTTVNLGSTDDQRPLVDFRARLGHSSDEDDSTVLWIDQLAFGGVVLDVDDGVRAIVSGAWVPAGVTPNLVYGTPEEDRLRSSAPLSLIWGGDGEDDIGVNGGEAFIWGGAGDDTVRGNAGRDFVWGGIGDDIIRGKGGDDFLSGDIGDDVIEAGSGDDRVYGGQGFDLIRGGAGNDFLDGYQLGPFGGGLPAFDVIFGGAGNDIIISGTGHIDESNELERSTSNGGSGDDIIVAVREAILTGGKGADSFQIGNSSVGRDHIRGVIITDFRPGIDSLGIIIPFEEDYNSFEEVMAAATQVGSDVVFEFVPEYPQLMPSLVLEDVQLSRLTAGDFFFSDLLV